MKPTSPIVATITSPTISNTKRFVKLSNEKKKQLICPMPKCVRKASESSTSSASNGKDIKIPTKNEIAGKKQRRWALKNGIEVYYKSPQVARNEAQLKGVTFLRELSHALIYSSSSPKQKESPKIWTLDEINCYYDAQNDKKYTQSQSTTAFHIEIEKKENSSDVNVPYNDTSAIITLIQCEYHHKGKVRRQTTGALQL
jgi:hypothetical protein